MLVVGGGRGSTKFTAIEVEARYSATLASVLHDVREATS